MSGRVVLSSPGGNPPFLLTRGYALNPGDRIDTRGGGQAVIDLSDGSIVVVHPESIVEIKDFRAAASLRELFEITLGQVKVRINHFAGRPNPYRMNSPTASIAVRGTEFTIAVDAQGSTEVTVQEGVVEVTSLSDPSHRVLIEAGRGVLVQAGQDFHLLTAPVAREFGEHDHDDQELRHQGGENRPVQAAQHPASGSPSPDTDPHSPRSTPGTYDRYIASLSQIGQIPFLFRYNAFAEPYLDSLENPAYATAFHAPEARLFLLPSFSGVRGLRSSAAAFGPQDFEPGNYGISPQFSMFTPLAGTPFVLGASVAASRMSAGADTVAPDFDPGVLGGAPNLRRLTGSSSSSFYSSTAMAAARFGKDGATSIGFSLDSLRGAGSLFSSNAELDAGQVSTELINARSNISQTRLTLGLTRNLGGTMKLGAYYRYGFIEATDGDRLHTVNGSPMQLDSTNSSGHISEAGVRVRGMLSPRLSYGIAAGWLGLTLGDGLIRSFAVASQQRDRSQRGSLGGGFGYLLNRRTLLAFDLAGGYSNVDATRAASATGGLLQRSGANSRFISVSGSGQVDVTRKLFASASLMTVWQRYEMGTQLFPDQFGNMVPVMNPLFPVAGINPLVGRYFSDFGAGWRFSPQFFAQYLYSTDYGATNPSHTIMLEYTFHLHRE